MKKFNEKVGHIRDQLRSQGNDPADIVPQLFDVYFKCTPHVSAFHSYIVHLQNTNEDLVMGITSQQLMKKAEVKYKVWSTPDGIAQKKLECKVRVAESLPADVGIGVRRRVEQPSAFA